MKAISRYNAIVLCAASTLWAGALQASPITITQHFGPANEQMLVNGSLQTVTGDWVFRIVTDTSNPDLDPDTRFGIFAATVTVSNSGLGVTDMLVTSYTNYWEWLETDWTASGITTGMSGGTQLVRIDNQDIIGDPNVIESAYLDFTAQEATLNFFSNAPLILQDGTTVVSYDFSTKQPQTQMESGYSTTVVPVPAAVWLFGSGLIGLIGVSRRKKA